MLAFPITNVGNLVKSCRKRVMAIWLEIRWKRGAQHAALLVDEVLSHAPMRQWVLSFPFQLRFLFAAHPAIMGQVLGIVYGVTTDLRLAGAK